MSESISGPHVQLATFCDMILEDKTGALSVIRMIDRYTVAGQTPEMQPTPVKTTLAVAVKAGFMNQKARLKIQPIRQRTNSLREILPKHLCTS